MEEFKMNKRLLQTCLAGLLLSAPVSSYSYGVTYEGNSCDFTASVDYLYWNVCRSGLDTIISRDHGCEQSSKVLGDVHYIDHEWNSGFRVQLGYKCDDSYDLSLRYTHFKANPDQHISCIDGSATRLHPLMEAASCFQETSVDAEYDIKYNVLDLELGSWMKHGCNGHLRPFVGFRYASIDQEVDALYILPLPTPTHVYASKQTSDLDSYGVTLGFDFRHQLCDSFNVIGRVAGGAHYGDFSYATNQANIIDPCSVKQFVNVHGHDCRAVYSSEVAIGLEYDFCGFCGTDFSIAVGYELQTWHDLMDFQDFTDGDFPTKITRNDASLLLHGLFVRLGAEF
jgi:Legionella pneumophila major outer membrane protein precursor